MVGAREQQRTQSEGDMGDTKDWFAVFAATMMGALMLAFVVMVQPFPVCGSPSPDKITVRRG